MARSGTRRTQQERSETTIAQLVAAAREVFAADGYQAAMLDDILARTGLSKGALYHHFAGKRELFEAVYEQEARKLAVVGAKAYARKRDPWEGLHAAIAAFFEASLDPGVQRITLLDAPGVLGWERLREIEDRHTVASLRIALQTAMDHGIIAPRPVELLVQMINGAICEAGMAVARSENPRAATKRVLADLRLMVDALADGR